MRLNNPNSLVAEFRNLSQELTTPLSSWKFGDVIVKIYRPKNLYEAKWVDEVAKELVFAARRFSNLLYGRPLTDKYDPQSAIYAGSATYPLLIGREYFFLKEWLSVRLVPGNGNPRGTGELEIYTCRGENVADVVRRKFFQGDHDFLNFIAASNRMCGCRPYFKSKSDEKRMTVDLLPKKIQHTALLYALINKHFVDDYLIHFGSRYITGVIIDQLVDKALTINIGSGRYGAYFKNAHELLGVAPNEIKLDRHTNNNYAYHYPTYFLNVRQLLQWLDGLISRGLLTRESIEHYLKTDLSFSEIAKQPNLHLECLRNLRKLFSASGQICGSGLTGDDLRGLANIEVEDGPKLRITPISDMMNSIEVFLNAAGIK